MIPPRPTTLSHCSDTAVCSVIAVEELSWQYSMSRQNTNLFLEMALAASILYLLMSYPLSLAAGWLERRLKPRPAYEPSPDRVESR